MKGKRIPETLLEGPGNSNQLVSLALSQPFHQSSLLAFDPLFLPLFSLSFNSNQKLFRAVFSLHDCLLFDGIFVEVTGRSNYMLA